MIDLSQAFNKFQEDKIINKNLIGKVLLIDFLNLFIRNFSSRVNMDSDGNHSGGLVGSLLSLGSVIRQFKPSRIIICVDGVGGSLRRRKLFPEYKAKRHMLTQLNRVYDFSTIQEEKESMKHQMLLLMKAFEYLPITTVAPENVEADDVIAYLTKIYQDRGKQVMILSTDKDFLQLVNENVCMYNGVKKKVYTPSEVTKDYGIHPNNFILYRMITGDQSDCIPGVEGIKEKTLLKYFPELAEEDKKDLSFLLESAKHQAEGKKKIPVSLQKFIDSQELLELNYRLMRLDDAFMSGSTKLDVLKYVDEHIPTIKSFELTKLLSDAKIGDSLGQLDRWLSSTFSHLSNINS